MPQPLVLLPETNLKCENNHPSNMRMLINFLSPTLQFKRSNQKCYFCGGVRHPKFRCHAKDKYCENCGRKGHFSQVCQTNKYSGSKNKLSASIFPTLASILAASPSSLHRTVVKIKVNDNLVDALIDTGSSDSFICSKLVNKLCLIIANGINSFNSRSNKYNTKTSVLQNLRTNV